MVLASASSARARLLSNVGVIFEIDQPNLDEASIKRDMARIGADTTELARRLAEAKAQTVSARQPDAAVIGADQILEQGGTWFDKPESLEDARQHLQRLRGRTHCLISAVCVVFNGDRIWQHVETARLTMRVFSDEFLNEYLERAGDGCLVSVGAYQLEKMGAQLFERIDGDHFAIQGLSLLPLLRFLRRKGILYD